MIDDKPIDFSKEIPVGFVERPCCAKGATDGFGGPKEPDSQMTLR